MGGDGAGTTDPVIYLLLLLKLIESGSQRDYVHFSDIEAEVVERVDFDGSLGGRGGTSVLQERQVMEVLMYPTKGFSSCSSSSYSSSLTEAVRSMFFCPLSTVSTAPMMAAYNSCASCCSKLIRPYLISLIELSKLPTEMVSLEAFISSYGQIYPR